jgi:capsular polysaccharide biosynthesis protein
MGFTYRAFSFAQLDELHDARIEPPPSIMAALPADITASRQRTISRPQSLSFFEEAEINPFIRNAPDWYAEHPFSIWQMDAVWFRYCHLVCTLDGRMLLDCMPQGKERFPFSMLIHQQKHTDGSPHICFNPQSLPLEDRLTVLGGHYAIGIFGHFILDLLCTASMLSDSLLRGDCRLGLFGCSSWMAAFLRQVGITEDQYSVYGDRGTRFSRALITPAISAKLTYFPGSVALRAFDMLRRGVEAATASPRDHKLYLFRGNDGRRFIENEENLAALLSARGFRVVRMAELEARAQCALMASSRLVISLFGSSLTLAPLMDKGSKVIEILPDFINDPWFIRLASVFELEYHAFFVKGQNTKSVKVDLDRFVQFLDYVGE